MITAVYSYMLEKNPILYQVSAYLVSYCLLLRQQQRFEHPTLKQTSVLLGCIQNSTISSKHVHCCILVHVSCFFWGGWDLALYKGVLGFELETYRHAHHEQRVYTVLYMCRLFFSFLGGFVMSPFVVGAYLVCVA